MARPPHQNNGQCHANCHLCGQTLRGGKMTIRSEMTTCSEKGEMWPRTEQADVAADAPQNFRPEPGPAADAYAVARAPA